MKSPHLSSSHSLTTFLFIFFFTSSHGQDDQQYTDCNDNHFNCGQTIQNISFPFWGNNRPRNCGLQQYSLICHEDNYTTININEQTYRVLEIDQSTWLMRLVHDQLSDNICLPGYVNITIAETLFSYRPNYENLTLFYNCSNPVNVLERDNFICPFEGADRRGFFVENGSATRNSEECNINITVPVLTRGVEEFWDNQTLGIRDLLNFGFDVDFRIDYLSSCLACNASGGLCWINTTIAESTCLCPNGIHPHDCTNPGKGLNMSLKIGIGIGAAAFALILFCCIRMFPTIRSLRLWKMETNMDRNVEDFIRQPGSHNPKRYSYSDIKKMTKSFKDELGRGGYGSVYKGKLPNGRLVAVKILNASKGNGEEFVNEVASIGRTSHINVVTLFGFCYNGKRRALVYEYMPNGSLDKFLNNRDNHLSSEKLYEISLGIARGLEYLHRGCNTRILHFDIKPHNILLDDDFCPKIADFGLAKMYYGKDSIVSMAETRGTIGYIAPELFNRNFGKVSHKSDVYSYGMLLIEMVGGKSNCNSVGVVNNSSDIYFPNWIYKRLELNENLGLEGVMLFEESEITKRMLIVGLWCIQMDPMHRPPMNKVIDMLLGSLEYLQIPPKPFLSSLPRLPPVLYSSTSGASSYE